jgi:hypothetical protein
MLQIAQHAGGGWPEQARRSAIYLSRAPYEPSVGVQLLAALRSMFTESSKSLAKTCKSCSHSPVALGSRIQASTRGRPLMWRAMPERMKARDLFLGAGASGTTASFGN